MATPSLHTAGPIDVVTRASSPETCRPGEVEWRCDSPLRAHGCQKLLAAVHIAGDTVRFYHPKTGVEITFQQAPGSVVHFKCGRCGHVNVWQGRMAPAGGRTAPTDG
jgi:hypothetical protein